jgi:hypothetical protein
LKIIKVNGNVYLENTSLVTVSTQKLFSGGLDLNLMMGEMHSMEKGYFVL